MSARIGVDFGGVIVANRGQVAGEDTALVGIDDEQLARDGVFEVLSDINSTCHGSIWIVSKAGPRMRAKTTAWLEAVDFFSRTGIDRENVRFCLRREEKATICQELGLSHFVDDRVHVMQILRHIVPNLYLFGEPRSEKNCPPWATFVSDWRQIGELLSRPQR